MMCIVPKFFRGNFLVFLGFTRCFAARDFDHVFHYLPAVETAGYPYHVPSGTILSRSYLKREEMMESLMKNLDSGMRRWLFSC